MFTARYGLCHYIQMLPHLLTSWHTQPNSQLVQSVPIKVTNIETFQPVHVPVRFTCSDCLPFDELNQAPNMQVLWYMAPLSMCHLQAVPFATLPLILLNFYPVGVMHDVLCTTKPQTATGNVCGPEDFRTIALLFAVRLVLATDLEFVIFSCQVYIVNCTCCLTSYLV
jgi:hypothetical protein